MFGGKHVVIHSKLTNMEENDEILKDQENWTRTARLLQKKLESAIEVIPAHRIEDLKLVTDMTRAALWMHQEALTFEKEIELKMRKIGIGD